MTIKHINIGIVHYPGALLSAVQGLTELFYLANNLCHQHHIEVTFNTQILAEREITQATQTDTPQTFHVIILPPGLKESGYIPKEPAPDLTHWLRYQHQRGAILSSVCAGAFLLAQTGLLAQRQATTHWALADDFAKRYPQIKLNASKILINDGDLITAGGIMSWIDLGLALVGQFSQPQIMRYLGKYLIVDTAPREQSYYQSFAPKLAHGDGAILTVQHYLQAHFHTPIAISSLATMCHLTQRTLLRRFVKATGLKPSQYLQRLRIQKACDLIESRSDTVETIAAHVGYEDLSAFRRAFIKITGQTPKAFKQRFVGH